MKNYISVEIPDTDGEVLTVKTFAESATDDPPNTYELVIHDLVKKLDNQIDVNNNLRDKFFM